ncbi:C6 transcription factor [Fonsecaea pedrosoi]|nr:C6 transcription factor [Fonsecaea pedrosoi]
MSMTAQSLNSPIPIATAPPSSPGKPKRVLACVLCQQRKVKCDRIFPCANCVRSRVQCVPSPLLKRRLRRRPPQKELLERIAKYEDLLRQNNVKFEPLHNDIGLEKGKSVAGSGYGSDGEPPENMDSEMQTPSTTSRSGRSYGVKNVWHVMSQGFRDSDSDSAASHENELESAVKDVYDQSVVSDDNLLFGARGPAVNLSSLHPDPVQVFRLWQIYSDNVNPLLKVTHTPSLQGRLIEAVSDISKISPTLEALMFSIYCVAISSHATEDCQRLFECPKEDLLMRYHYACQQALLNCSFLRTNDRDCLTALYLYLSLSSVLAVVIRIAQRMGIHSESVLAKHTIFEAEMRRRLWWSLVLFDTRVSETTNSRTATLDPTWDCKVPLNVNDSDLQPDMRRPPVTQGNTTEALFAVVRCELGEVIRHSSTHLDFTTPALKVNVITAQSEAEGDETELVRLEKMIEDRYLRHCDQEHPLQFMTMWTTRAHLAKYRLLEHQSRYFGSSSRQTNAQRHTATSYALTMLECNTKLMASPLTKRFRWLNKFYFPFPAYIQIVQELRSQPLSSQACHAWEVMSDNYSAWFGPHFREDSPFFRLFTKLVLQAWEAYEAAPKRPEDVLMTEPRVVSSIKHALSQIALRARDVDTGLPSMLTRNPNIDDGGGVIMPSSMHITPTPTPTPMGMGFWDHGMPYNNISDGGNNNEIQDDFALFSGQMDANINMAGQPGHLDPWNWTGFGGQPGWEGV